MIEFIAGAIFGNTILGKDGAKTLWFLPVAMGIILLFGCGVWEAVSWYIGSASQTYHSGPWYSWPWNWPGAYLSDKLSNSLSNFWSEHLFGPSAPKVDPKGMLEFLIWLPATLMRAGVAIAINEFVALLPLFAISCVSRLWRRNRRAQIPQVAA